MPRSYSKAFLLHLNPCISPGPQLFSLLFLSMICGLVCSCIFTMCSELLLMCLFLKKQLPSQLSSSISNIGYLGIPNDPFFPLQSERSGLLKLPPVPSFSSLCRESLKWSSVSTIRMKQAYPSHFQEFYVS